MLLNKKKFLFCVLIFVCLFASASTDDLTMRFLDKANDSYSSGKINEAYTYVNKALQLNKGAGISANIATIAETIYYDKLELCLKTSDYAVFSDITVNLEEYPIVASVRIKKLVKQIYAQQTAAKEAKEEAKSASEQEQRKAEDVRRDAEMSQYREQQTTLMKELNSGFGQIDSGLSRSAEMTSSVTHQVFVIVVIVCSILLLVVAVIAFFVHFTVKSSRKQQEVLTESLKVLTAMANPTGRPLLGNVTDLYRERHLKIAGRSSWNTENMLPEPDQLSDEQKSELQQMAIKCEELGTEIDRVTRRKNNSKNVSELVYKLAVELGVPQSTAMVYFDAAMVYDVGFLKTDRKLLEADNLSPDQRTELGMHTKLYEGEFQFVPEQYREIFENAAAMHHENIDGSGYPSGVKGNAIPQIARLIRVAESFVSLSSSRSYRNITDKETAINTLKECPEIYDKDVVEALEAIL